MNDENRDHERWSEDAAAYMLGALEPDETVALERHLEGCERCREQIRWLAPAVQALPEAVARVEPPGELRARLLAEVREDARRARAEAAAGGGERRRAPAWLRRLGGGSLGLRPIAGLAALALVVVALAGYEIGTEDGGSSGGEVTSTVVAGHPPGVTARVIREGDGATLHLADVRQVPGDRVLEAWVARGKKITPVRALFVPDRQGRASTTIADMRGVDTVMVTVEPKGGTRAPTSTPIVTVPIPQ